MHERIAEHWDHVPGYLNVASVGVPPRETVAAMRADPST